jgi:hypothetical protein
MEDVKQPKATKRATWRDLSALCAIYELAGKLDEEVEFSMKDNTPLHMYICEVFKLDEEFNSRFVAEGEDIVILRDLK